MLLKPRNNGRGGFVLIAVLLVVVLLAVVLLEFNYAARTDLHISDNCYRAEQALCCADAGVNVAIAAIRQTDDPNAPGPIATLLDGSKQISIGDAGFCTVSVAGENGKINVNALKMADGRPDRRKVEQLLRLIDLLNLQYGDGAPIGYGIVPAIIDWADADGDLTYLPFVKRDNEGAERQFYEKLPTPYTCKNAPFDAINELLLVKGITPAVFRGRPADDATGTRAVSGLGQFLTVWGDGRIDINHASAEVIESLSEKITPPAARAIVEHRATSPFTSIEELRNVQGVTPEMILSIADLITAKPDDRYYRISARGVAGDFTREVIATVKKNGKTRGVTLLMREEP